MQVYKKILVTMDCSAVDDAIVEHVSALALQNNAAVYLLHVTHSHTLDQDRALHKQANASLKSSCQALQARGIAAHMMINASMKPGVPIPTKLIKVKI